MYCYVYHIVKNCEGANCKILIIVKKVKLESVVCCLSSGVIFRFENIYYSLNLARFSKHFLKMWKKKFSNSYFEDKTIWDFFQNFLRILGIDVVYKIQIYVL